MGTDRVREVEMPAEVPALTTLARVDYQDAFRVEAPEAAGHSGEEWARAALEGAPATMQSTLRRGWAAIGLKLDSPDCERTVLGWGVRRGDAELALLGVDSRIGMPAELLFRPEPDGLLFATFIERRTPLARATWAPIGPGHRLIVPELLARAPGRLSRAAA
jgi:hypothetical protein